MNQGSYGWITEGLKKLSWEYKERSKKEIAYSTWDSQAVSDPSTNQAQRCLTWQIGRDVVFSTWYGRKQMEGGEIFWHNWAHGETRNSGA